MQSSEHPCHQIARHQYKSWEKNRSSKKITGYSDYNHKLLANNIERTSGYFVKETSDQSNLFLSEILNFAIELNQYLFNCKKLLLLLATNDACKFYQLWVNEILINRGWLFLQSLFQMALLSYDLKYMNSKSTSSKINSKTLYQTIDKRLTPVYHCKGLALADYWHPIFLYILHHPHAENDTKELPVNYRANRKTIDNEMFLVFQNNLKVDGEMNWISRFGKCLGLLD